MRTWLMKSEPDVFSVDELRRVKRTGWEGVRNYQARNFLRDMAVGDLALYYHSNAAPSGVAGVMKVVAAASPDPTQFDPKSEYFDAGSSVDEPRWSMVTVGFVEKFERVLALAELKADKRLAGMGVLQRGQRLSVMPVSASHFARVLELAGAKTRLG